MPTMEALVQIMYTVSTFHFSTRCVLVKWATHFLLVKTLTVMAAFQPLLPVSPWQEKGDQTKNRAAAATL